MKTIITIALFAMINASAHAVPDRSIFPDQTKHHIPRAIPEPIKAFFAGIEESERRFSTTPSKRWFGRVTMKTDNTISQMWSIEELCRPTLPKLAGNNNPAEYCDGYRHPVGRAVHRPAGPAAPGFMKTLIRERADCGPNRECERRWPGVLIHNDIGGFFIPDERYDRRLFNDLIAFTKEPYPLIPVLPIDTPNLKQLQKKFTVMTTKERRVFDDPWTRLTFDGHLYDNKGRSKPKSYSITPHKHDIKIRTAGGSTFTARIRSGRLYDYYLSHDRRTQIIHFVFNHTIVMRHCYLAHPMFCVHFVGKQQGK